MNPVNKIVWAIGAVIGLTLMIIFVWLILANAHLKIQVAQAEENITACHLANDEFVAQVTRQNKAVELMKQQSALQEKHLQARENAAQKIRASYLAAAEKIRAEKARGNLCNAANNIFNDYVRQAR